ncbi:glycosyltransferase family 39 protein [Paenibacillus agaridevorans]|uniref:glycosyltransferase family 39 protein n=1 Tax=Paenibacillus agaridevorans TaxID=171404 RepID=UPI001BE451E0|nr:glycosyltransferase family 39 protein [Paenibacillus agaridevorans]
MNKAGLRRLTIPLMLLALWLCSVLPAHAAGNLVVNGDFEQTEGGMPVNWTTEAWIKDDVSTEYSVELGSAQSGEGAASIRNHGDNHARFIQTVRVESDKLYRISGYVKAEGLRLDAYGAYLSVEGVAVQYPQVHDTGGQWSYLEYYGRTAKDQKEITIGVSVGGYGSINAGSAAFDGVSVEEVGETPAGAVEFSLASSPVSGGDEQEQAPIKVSILSTLLFAALFTVFFAVVRNALLRQQDRLRGNNKVRDLLLYGGFAAALAVRIAIGLSHEGYANDIALFTFWSDQVVKEGIAGFYHTNIFVDYPPGYIYVLYIVGLIKEWLGFAAGSAGTLLLYKLPAIAADLVAAAVIYRAARGKLGEAPAIGLALIYAFNPAAILDSAAWGQVDAVFALVLTLAIAGMAERKFGRASVWYAIAALIKPQTFIFMPILLVALLLGRKWKDVAVSAYYGFGTFILLALPFFWGHGGLKGVYELYKGTLSSYPYATLNAFNLYSLTGGNWAPLTDKWLFIPYQTWGSLFIGAAVLAVLLLSFARVKRNNEDRSFYVAMILIAIVFIGVTKMHERYMFPVMLLSLFAYIQSMDRRMLRLFFGFTITNFINMSYVLKFSEQTTNVPTDGVVILCSLANIGLLLYGLYVGHDLYRNGNRQQAEMLQPDDRLRADAERLEPFRVRTGERSAGLRRLNRKDWWWMGGITAVYTIVALVNLGSFKDPETVWHPSSAGEGFYVDLGEVKQLERLTSFGGVGTGTYAYEFAETPDVWNNRIEVDNNHVYVFAWKSQQLDVKARYVKLTVTGAGFSMNELGIYEAGSKEPLPISSIVALSDKEPKRGAITNLFDEQKLMVYNHEFMKGSYFDEIYHARTAYENLEGLVAYENTHPPLGKLIIAIGIKLFGLNPFGWRIAGTLFGAAMIPLIYLMARRLFGGTTFAAIAALLLAADFMHFTQTRIATIDVYGVFFIMLMFYFMHRYVTMNFYRSSLLATFVPLGLAGLAFGLGVASKWIVLYGGAGLAIMLALSLIDRYKEYAAAKRRLKQGDGLDGYNRTELERASRLFPRNTIITLAACLLFYIGVPAGIYALSYIPILNVMSGGYTLKALVDYTTHMYNYHSQLVSSHPFSSSWWEWPFMKRPVWYYSGSELPEGMKSTIVAMGNPLIWWIGLFTMMATAYISIKRKDRSAYMIWIAFLAQYVPWMLVPRETFLYHYFAMVPFIILATVYCLKHVEELRPGFAKARNAYVAAAIGLFVMFYPALSGMLVPKWYVDVLLRWFPSWLF